MKNTVFMHKENKADEKNRKPVKGKGRNKPKVPKKITERYLLNSGTYYLQRFTASSGHFRKVMMRKIDNSCYHHKEQDREKCIEMLDKLVVQFQEYGLLDDESYTRGSVRSLRNRGLSEKAIIMKLKQKALPHDMIRKYLDIIDGENDLDSDLQAALKLARKKRMGPFAAERVKSEKNTEEAAKERNRDLGRFARAGFSFDIALKVMDMSYDEAAGLIGI